MQRGSPLSTSMHALLALTLWLSRWHTEWGVITKGASLHSTAQRARYRGDCTETNPQSMSHSEYYVHLASLATFL